MICPFVVQPLGGKKIKGKNILIPIFLPTIFLPSLGHDPTAAPFINTAASARCSSRHNVRKLFQQFARTLSKPLKRLYTPAGWLHRAKAAVLMRCQLAPRR
ncbi:MAG: hypothetical protein C5B50_29545 [Verrucomicrobia bacterium]|nr:MAG: hypothetical protein C5B50_29545 [Verrucomicrobiota bacterium]